MTRNKKIRLTAIFVILLCGGILAGLALSGALTMKTPDLDTAAVKTGVTYDGKKNTDTIDIPGFGSMTFKADEKVQQVNFENPPQNTCYFKLTMKDPHGKVLWKSDLIPPGAGIYKVTLDEPIRQGVYSHYTMEYECFAMDKNLTPLNGSVIDFLLNVQK